MRQTTQPSRITDQLDEFPCAQELARSLPNLENDISKLLNSTFGNNDRYHISFNAKSGLGEIDGYEISSGSYEFDTFKSTIYLNDEMLNNATKEYILITMFHEAIHSFLRYEMFKLGQEMFSSKYPMFIVYSEKLPNGIPVFKYYYDHDHSNFGLFIHDLKKVLSSFIVVCH
ncbi:hypothetical protein [Chryseobacterium sp. A301]